MIATIYALNLRLIGENPPREQIEGRPVRFGLQSRKDELQPGTSGPGGALIFSAEAQVTLFNDERVHRELRGLYVHGKREEPFLYLSLRFDESDVWLRRWKILLDRVDDDLLRRADGRLIEAAFDLQGGNAGPRLWPVRDWTIAGSKAR